MTKSKLAFLLGLAIPAFFAFRALLLPGPAVWGDAPYFYPEGLKDLVAEPYAWTSRGTNFGGPNNLLWISPLMFVYGLLNKIFGFDNGAIIRILFYFPSIALAFVTPIALLKRLGYSRAVQFFASLVYALNTYFLLVVDGGQIGVALAYGLFPLALLHLRKLAVQPSFVQFFGSLAIFFLLVVSDVRFAAIAVFTLALWLFVDRLAIRRYEANGMRFLFLLALTTIALSSYWLIPLSRLGAETLSVDVSKLQLLSLLNPLFLFQPHWPLNEFGKVFPPPFYFAGIPLLVFGGLFWLKDKHGLFSQTRIKRIWSMALLVLVFVFLAKGETPPLGGIYSWAVNLPFGSALRDSTKFFVPLLLFAGVLIGITVEHLTQLRYLTPLHKHSLALYKHSLTAYKGVTFSVYLYLLFLVHPAILGNLNGVLAGRAFPQDFETIHQRLTGEESFFRSLWFPERSPFAFHTEEKPALDAKRLVDRRPFASLNVGTFDAFNFLHNEQYLDWFDILGIKYLVLPGDPRKPSLNKEERKDWDNLLKLVEDSSLEKVDWGTNFPVYRVSETKPHIFATNKLVAVVGADDIYEKLKAENGKFSIGNQGFVFFEDGKFNPRSLEEVVPESVIMVLNKKDETDLAMSFLQEQFIGPSDSKSSQWAVRDADDYLRYKYELLINKVDIKEFDYGRGIAFSSVRDQEISWDLDVARDGDYILAVRILRDNGFSWGISDLSLRKGTYPLTLINDSGLKVVNVVALIPKDEWEEAQRLSRQFINYFDVATLEDGSGAKELIGLLADTRWQEVVYERASPVRYKINIPEGARWLVFSDNYGKDWILERGPVSLPSYPFYSMINGFNPRPEWREAEIVFEGQKDVRWGIYWSTISFLLLLIIFISLYAKKRAGGND